MILTFKLFKFVLNWLRNPSNQKKSKKLWRFLKPNFSSISKWTLHMEKQTITICQNLWVLKLPTYYKMVWCFYDICFFFFLIPIIKVNLRAINYFFLENANHTFRWIRFNLKIEFDWCFAQMSLYLVNYLIFYFTRKHFYKQKIRIPSLYILYVTIIS